MTEKEIEVIKHIKENEMVDDIERINSRRDQPEHHSCRICGHNPKHDHENFIDGSEESFVLPKKNCMSKYCLVRSKDFGVFFGKVIEKHGMQITLKDSQQIVSYDWSKICLGRESKFFLHHGLKTVSLSLAAKHGIDKKHAILCPQIQFRELHAEQIYVASKTCFNSVKAITPKGRKEILQLQKREAIGI